MKIYIWYNVDNESEVTNMSQWTHVASCFRIDSFGEISDEQIYNFFWKICF